MSKGFKGAPRIAHVLPFPAVGGTEIATLRVMNAAREHGIDSVAFCRDNADSVRALFDTAGFETVPYSGVEPSYRSPSGYIMNSIRLARAFRQRRIALVHAADLLGALLTGYAARAAGLPLLCHVRNRYSRLSRRDRSFLAPVNRFVFVSHHTWRHFAVDVPATRGCVLYDGIQVDERASAGDRSVRAEFGLSADAPLIGMVARVAPQKDFPTLIEAARRVVARSPNAYFMVVGDHSSTESLRKHYAETRRLLDAAGLAQRFVFTGFRTDVPRFMRSFDVFVLSTHWEGLPLVLLEAMAHGTPVVATSVDGIPELIEHGQNGLLYAPQDADGLAHHLARLLTDEAEAKALGRAGRDAVAARFSSAVFARNVAALYDGMIGSRPATQARITAVPGAAVTIRAAKTNHDAQPDAGSA